MKMLNLVFIALFAQNISTAHTIANLANLNPAVIQPIQPINIIAQRALFTNYLRNFQIVISTPDDFSYRLNIFIAKRNEIEIFNSIPRSYLKGLNSLSFLTLLEKRKLLGDKADTVAAPADSLARVDGTAPNEAISRLANDITIRQTLLWPINIIFLNLFNFIFPQSKDFHAENKMTPVRDQKTCGSCWAFGATGVVESAYKIKYGVSYNLAEQELVDCSHELGSGGCGGGFAQGALEYYKNKGVRNESAYPYTDSTGTCKPRPFLTIIRKISSYVEVLPGNMLTYISNLRYRPLTTSFYVVDSFFDYASGIFDADAECAGIPDNSTNHAVVAVGYNLSAAKPYIKIRNSWNAGWGESGYFRMPLKKIISQKGACNMIQKHRAYYPLIA